MSRITNIAGGTVKDLDAFRAIFDEAIAIVENDLPGTVTYASFIDEETSRFVANGTYVDGAAFQKHAKRLMAAGILTRMADLAEFDLNIALGDVDDDVRDLLRNFGFKIYAPLAAARS